MQLHNNTIGVALAPDLHTCACSLRPSQHTLTHRSVIREYQPCLYRSQGTSNRVLLQALAWMHIRSPMLSIAGRAFSSTVLCRKERILRWGVIEACSLYGSSLFGVKPLKSLWMTCPSTILINKVCGLSVQDLVKGILAGGAARYNLQHH